MTGSLKSDKRFELKRGEQDYPQSLLDLEAAPEILYGIGDPKALSKESISIIGARKATPYGLACAELTGTVAAQMGLQVVSGAAIGCDQAAQRSALKHGTTSVAVLGCGADVVYPSNAHDMLDALIARGGATVSMLPWGTHPTKYTFVLRNTLIAALSSALVICEAGMPSGTFSTAEAAERMGREVLVYPGSFFSPNSRGSNYLIATGSMFMPLWDENCLREAIARIYGRLTSLSLETGIQGNTAGVNDTEVKIIDALVASPMAAGELAGHLGLDVQQTMRSLGGLAARGIVERLVDGRYSPTKSFFVGHHGPGKRREITGADR